MIPGGRVWITYPSRADVLEMSFSGDWHLWSRGCARKHLVADLKRVEEDDHAFLLGGGDYADLVGYTDSRFDPAGLPVNMRARDLGKLGRRQMEDVRDLLWPLRERVVGLLYGNHEWKYMLRKDAQDLHGWLCTELGVKNLGYSTIFDIIFVRRAGGEPPKLWQEAPPKEGLGNNWRVRVMAHHGAGAATTPGGKLNKLLQAMDYFPLADLVLLAHVHEQTVKPQARLDGDRDCKRLIQRKQYGAICGSYLLTYAEGDPLYPERGLMRPVLLGPTVIRFTPGQRKIRVEV